MHPSPSLLMCKCPTGAQMLALGLCSRAEPSFSHCTTAPTSSGSFTHTHADEAEEIHVQVCLPVDAQCSVLASPCSGNWLWISRVWMNASGLHSQIFSASNGPQSMTHLQSTVHDVLPHIKTNHAPEKIILLAKYKKHLDG